MAFVCFQQGRTNNTRTCSTIVWFANNEVIKLFQTSGRRCLSRGGGEGGIANGVLTVLLCV